MINKSSTSLQNFLRVTAPAKINLHLEILGFRSDGFHELAMVMQSVDLRDELELSGRNDGEIKLTCDDSTLGTESDNLIIKAAKLLKRHSDNHDLGANIYLKKRIPIGAGLAGGSSDAAATLMGLNSLWELFFTKDKLKDLSSELGSDVPFCLEGGTQLCFGRGEVLEPLFSFGNPMAIVLVKDPSISVSTPVAYGLFKQLKFIRYLRNESEFEKRRQSLRDASWLRPIREDDLPPLRNDLQEVIEPMTPAVQRSLNLLQKLPGSLTASMSGSGPSCFALYGSLESARKDHIAHLGAFKEAGLESWCCAFSANGVTVES